MTKNELRSVLPGGKHHDVAMKWVADDAAVLQYRHIGAEGFIDCDTPNFKPHLEWRIKPQVLRYRVALMRGQMQSPWLQVVYSKDSERVIEHRFNFGHWLSDWNEVEL